MAEIIGLFPLGLVLLPGERVPLHIFEPRYKELIGACVAEESEFGIVLLNSRGTREVGTKAGVVEVVEQYEDGQLDIIVEGADRFVMLDMHNDRSFLTAEIDDLVDEVPLPGADEYEACLADYRRAMSQVGSAMPGLDVPEPVPDHRGLAFQIAALFQMGIDVKQELLEMRSESQRLERLSELLEASAAQMRRQVIQKKASANGKVDHLGDLEAP